MMILRCIFQIYNTVKRLCKILSIYTFSQQKLLHYTYFTELQLAAATENYNTF